MDYEDSSRCVDRLERRRILERGKIAELRTPEVTRTSDAAHHFCIPRAWKIVDESYRFRRKRFAERIGDRSPEVFAELLALFFTRPQDDEADDGFALEVVGNGYGSRFFHRAMRDERALIFGRPDALAGDVDRVVRAAMDIPEAIGVDTRPIAMHPDVWEPRPVRR